MTHNTAELRVTFINGRWIYEVVNLTNFTLTNALLKIPKEIAPNNANWKSNARQFSQIMLNAHWTHKFN